MNRAQLRARTYEMSGVRADDPLASQATINRHIDSALRTITADYDWPWLVDEATVNLLAGQGDYPAPVSWLKTYELTIISGGEQGPLTYVSQLALDERWPDPTEQGVPQCFTISENVLRVRPVPDSPMVAVHTFKRGEPPLATDTASPLMPADYHDQLLALVSAMTLDGTRSQDRSAAYWQQYQAWARRLRDDQTRMVGPTLIRTNPNGWL